MVRSILLVAVGLVTACDDGTAPAVDARPADGAADDGPAGCPAMLEAELVDLDSSTASFAGVPGAKVRAEGLPAVVTTPPNGRLALCVGDTDPVRLTIDAPDSYLDSEVVIERAAMMGAPNAVPLSFRTLTFERAVAFYGEHGLTYDGTKAHVLVLLAGDRNDLALDRPHDEVIAASDDDNDGTFTWGDGAAGRYVLFPNVDETQPTAMLTGDPSGPHALPLASGTLTLAAVHFVFL